MKSHLVHISNRQIVYLVLIALLLVPLTLISRPSSGVGKNEGGQLAQLRAKYTLGDANIGQIDPRSSVIRFVSVGLEGIASLILWVQADEYKEKEDWTSYEAVLDNLIKLQPYYPVVWEHQAWNYSYNISAEFDDYHQRYDWIIKGISFLQQGTNYLQDNPRLLQRTGWFVSHKIGRADERIHYRRLFREDDTFHALQPFQERDNWLFGRNYYRMADDAVDNRGVRLTYMDPVLFHSNAIRAQMFAAEALATDYLVNLEAQADRPGTPAERAERVAEIDEAYTQQSRGRWSVADHELREFSQRSFAADDGTIYRLGEWEPEQAILKQKVAKLDALAPTLRKEIREGRFASLTLAEKESFRVDPTLRSEEQARLAEEAEAKLFVSDQDLAANVPDPKRAEAVELAKQTAAHEQKLDRIASSRKLIELDYWISRCELEQNPDASEAYKHFAHGLAAYKVDTDLITAKRELEAGFANWRKVLDQFPMMLKDQTAYTTLDVVQKYRQVLKQLDEPFPDKFILQDLLVAHREEEENTTSASDQGERAPRPGNR